MSDVSKEALDARPKKPLNPYFRFRKQKLKELVGNPNQNELLKQAWAELPEETKQAMNQVYRREMDFYEVHKEPEKLDRERRKQEKLQEDIIREQERLNTLKDFTQTMVENAEKELKAIKLQLPAKDEYRELCEKLKMSLNAMIDKQLE